MAAKCPDENTLSQLQWISPRLTVPIERDSSRRPEATFEADALTHFRANEYGDALNSAIMWMRFQPFSARPAVLASFISSVALEDYDKSIGLVEQALIASPKSFALRNNLAFALASAGRPEQASAVMRQFDLAELTPNERAVAKATLGLIAFRGGDSQSGRELYECATRDFRDSGDKYRAIVAELFWAREEHAVDAPASMEIVSRALSKAGNLRGFKVVEYLQKAIGKSA